MIRIGVRKRVCFVRDSYVGVAIAMARNEAFSTGPADGAVNGGQRDRAGASSRPKPEEGLRLMHAFLSIRHAALREAVIKLVTELSTLHDGEP